MRVDGHRYSVDGVVDAYKGWGPSHVGTVAVWIAGGSGQQLADRVRKMDAWHVIGRLAPGASRAGVEAQVRTAYHSRHQPTILPLPTNRSCTGVPCDGATARARKTCNYPVAMGATAVMLVLACANAANLLLASIARHERALTLRTALGASRGRLLRGITVEAAYRRQRRRSLDSASPPC